MNYVEFTAGGNDYKLRLTTRNIVGLEKSLGCNPLAIFGNGDKIPTITVMVQVLQASLTALQSGISLDKAYEIFDSYLADGNSMTDFIQVIVDIYKASGLIPNEDAAAKN